MSKDKPEVGDVFEIKMTQWKDYTKTFKAIVINTVNFVHPLCITDDMQSFFMIEGDAEYKYLGKSKANINELFEVQDE